MKVVLCHFNCPLMKGAILKSLNVFILQTKLCLYCSAWNTQCCTGTAGKDPNTRTGSPFLWAERSFINFTIFCNQ